MIMTDDERQGIKLAEVFSVRIDNIDGEDRCNLYGTIKVADSVFWLYFPTPDRASSTVWDIVGRCIYDREREDYESIKPGEMITLNGPYPCIDAYETFYIGFELWNYDNDEPVIREEIEWDFYENGSGTYNKLRYKEVVGIHGSLMLTYAVFDDAVQAFIEVILVKLAGEHPDPAHVYGFLGAQDNLLKKEIPLFQMSKEAAKEEYIEVRPGERIPLSRSVVVASLKSYLTVRADLNSTEYHGGHKIAFGTVDFPSQLSGTSTKNITGQYGEIEVKVTWTDDTKLNMA